MQKVTPKKKYDRSVEEVVNNFEDYDRHLEQQNKFSDALTALEETYHPSEVLCRDEEKQVIREYLVRSLEANGSSESLYISGVPGIGKTLCVKEVARRVCEERKQQSKYIYVNALTVRAAGDIFKSIYYEITKKKEDSKYAMFLLNELFDNGKEQLVLYNHEDRKKKKVLIIDEIDYLKTREEEVLYNIFEWTQKKRSNLIIIAISNTMDFPETLTQKLNSRIGNKRLPFKPYGSTQLEEILKQRVGPMNIFEEQAIIYICKKLVQCSSDVRKCLYILRESISEFLTRVRKDEKKKQIQSKKIPLELLVTVHDRIMNDTFARIFPDFPNAYKIVLYCFAKYFRSETRPCTMRQLNHLCGAFVKTQSQLKPVIHDLKDLGILNIAFYVEKTDARLDRNFINLKQLKQERFSLNIDYSKIIYALQKQNLEKINFNINLNF